MRSRHQEIKATRCRRPRPTRSSTYSEREREREREGGVRGTTRDFISFATRRAPLAAVLRGAVPAWEELRRRVTTE